MRTLIILTSVIIIGLIVSPAFAQSQTLVNYQGRLDNNSGNPVPDGNYQIAFMLYGDSIGGTPLWTEVHPTVHTTSGYFEADLGAITSLNGSNILDNPILYLQVQVGTEPPMTPRIRITSVPRSAIAQRMSGDIQTDDSSLVMQNSQKSIGLHTGSENMGVVVEDRPTDPVNARSFHIGIDSGEVNLGFKGPNGQDLFSVSGKPGSVGKLTWGLFNPQPEPPGRDNPVLQMNTGVGGNGSIVMFNPQPEPPNPDPNKLMEISSGVDGEASWVMFNPQPEPPGPDPAKLIEIKNNIGGDAGIYMLSPMPEPPATDPFMSLTATANGPNINLYAPQVGGARLVTNYPQLKMRCDSLSTEFLLQRGYESGTQPPDSTGFFMHADSVSSEMRFFKGGNINLRISTNASGTSSRYFNNGSEYMGIEPSPWHAGGDLTMYSAAGGPTLILASNGMVSIGTGNHTNILTVQQYSPTDPIADAWTTYSSRRWKTNIQPLQGSLAKVMQLQGVSYDQKEGGKHDIGLIAEDVGKVVPEVVAYEDNGVDAKSIDYARLTALLIEAVKEQQKTIDELKNELGELKSDMKNKPASSKSGE